jgi:hypothetical protein
MIKTKYLMNDNGLPSRFLSTLSNFYSLLILVLKLYLLVLVMALRSSRLSAHFYPSWLYERLKKAVLYLHY